MAELKKTKEEVIKPMSELARWFPEAEERHKALMQEVKENGLNMKPTQFPKAPPELTPSLDTFLDEYQRDIPGFIVGPFRREWTSGARELYIKLRAHQVPSADHPAFTRWAFRQHRKDKLDTKSPRSFNHLIDDYVRKGADPDSSLARSKYLKDLDF